MKYLAVLGRLAKISLAELEAQFGESVRQIAPSLAVFESNKQPDINRFGGVMKFGELIDGDPIEYLQNSIPEGKIILGVSDYTRNADGRKSQHEAMKFKKILGRNGRSVRVLSNDKNSGSLSTATVHHNQLGEKHGHVELIRVGKEWYAGCGVQNITAYAKRDQARPARDAKVGMLPPKLAQILINLCGPLPENSVILDPFCGTGVVLQESLLMGYNPLGTDLNDRMIEYSIKNLKWILNSDYSMNFPRVSINAQKLHDKVNFEKQIIQGDAMTCDWSDICSKISKNFKISAVACETYLGQPMSLPPVDIKLKTEKQECTRITLGFLKNIYSQIDPETTLALAIPAWRRNDGSYTRMNILDEIQEMGYNVVKFRGLNQDDMLYFRDGQVVAREIIVIKRK